MVEATAPVGSAEIPAEDFALGQQALAALADLLSKMDAYGAGHSGGVDATIEAVIVHVGDVRVWVARSDDESALVLRGAARLRREVG